MILVASYSAAAGGAERLLVEFVSALDGERCLACPEGPLAQSARAAGIRVFPLPPRSLLMRSARVSAARALAAHAHELRRLTRDLQPEAVIAWGMRPLLAGTLVRVPGPLVFQHNDLLPGPWLGRAVRWSARRAALVVALSATIARDLGFGEVIHPGVDLPAPTDPPEAPTIVVLGALVAWKRPDLALAAFARVREQVPDARLRFLGGPLEGHERFAAALGERAQAIGAVELPGAVSDAAVELARASCLLHCADREPFGLAVLETMAAGRPVVVPETGGAAEIADASCGLLYPPGSAEGAADALVRILSDRALAARLGAAGRARAAACFDRAAARERWARTVSSVRPQHTASSDSPPVGVVTVTRNSARELEALLAGLDRHLPRARVIVVDCASSDDTLAVAGERVTVPLSENVGFARACNRGLAEVDEPVTVLLNPDVELIDGSLAALASEVLRRDQPERLLAPLVLYPDGTRQDTVHPRPGTVADLARALVPTTLTPLAPWRADRPRRVGWAVGCALVARTDTLRRLGPFDDRLFLYGEDLDLGLRGAAAGVDTWFWPSARVLHHRAHASAREFGGEPFDRLARARREVIARRLGPGYARLDDAAQTVTFVSRITAKRIMGWSSGRERRQLAALIRAHRG